MLKSAVLVRCSILAGFLVASASAPLAATVAPTKPSDLVTLYGTSSVGCSLGVNSMKVHFQNKPDGTQTSGFVVPAGKVLVITDVTYRVYSSPTNVDFEGVLVPEQSGAAYAMVTGSRIEDAGGFGIATGSQHFSQGPVVKGGTTLCFVERQGRPINADSQVYVHGFLTRDR